MFRENDGLSHEVFQLSNTDVPLGGFASIANIISADKDEEVWMELLHFKDRQHMKEVIAKMEKDERCERSYKQSLDLLTPGAVFILGEFDRLTGQISYEGNKRITKEEKYGVWPTELLDYLHEKNEDLDDKNDDSMSMGEKQYRERLRLTIGELKVSKQEGMYWSTNDYLKKTPKVQAFKQKM